MKIVITGSSGFIGSNIKKQLSSKYEITGFDKVSANNAEVKIDVGSVKVISELKKYAPDIIIHCAAQKDLIECETKPEYFNSNVNSTRYICEYAKQCKSKVVLISSDVVFDGIRGSYSEHSIPHPINNYGLWKQLSENLTLFSKNNCVVRTAMVFGNQYIPPKFYLHLLTNQGLFPQYIINRIRRGMKTKLPINVISNPTPIDFLCKIIKKVIAQDANGIFHACPIFSMSRFEFGKRVCQIKGLDETLIIPFKQETGIRPLNLTLNSKSTLSKFKLEFTLNDFKQAIANIN